MMVDGKSQYYRQLPFRIRHIGIFTQKTDMLLMQIYVMMASNCSVRMPITVLTLPIHSVFLESFRRGLHEEICKMDN